MGLALALIQKIQIVVVKFIALYEAELWSGEQKNHENTVQILLNRQAKAITGVYPNTPIHPLLSKAGLISAET